MINAGIPRFGHLTICARQRQHLTGLTDYPFKGYINISKEYLINCVFSIKLYLYANKMPKFDKLMHY